jgi:hypothetical protein
MQPRYQSGGFSVSKYVFHPGKHNDTLTRARQRHSIKMGLLLNKGRVSLLLTLP